jgi:hypothetical protein
MIALYTSYYNTFKRRWALVSVRLEVKGTLNPLCFIPLCMECCLNLFPCVVFLVAAPLNPIT